MEVKVYCKYFVKALCLRDNWSKCEACPYYRIYLNEKY